MDVASFLSGRFAFLGLPKGRDPRSQQDGQVLSYVNDQIRRRYQRKGHPKGAFFFGLMEWIRTGSGVNGAPVEPQS